jgi:hypothetical protein
MNLKRNEIKVGSDIDYEDLDFLNSSTIESITINSYYLLITFTNQEALNKDINITIHDMLIFNNERYFIYKPYTNNFNTKLFKLLNKRIYKYFFNQSEQFLTLYFSNNDFLKLEKSGNCLESFHIIYDGKEFII